MLEIRLRNRASKDYIDSVRGKVLGPADVDVLLTGSSVKVYKPNGDPLLVYLPKAIPEDINSAAYEILHTIKGETTNRGLASGSKRVPVSHGDNEEYKRRISPRTYAKPVKSSIIGVIEGTSVAAPEHRMCRQTAWTGTHMPQWKALQPYLQTIARHFAEQVPQRYSAQMRQVKATQRDWIVPGTPFTTLTVNTSYPTGVHMDDGDLEEGFSCLAVIRRGTYSGGFLTFPEFRTAVNMRDGDLLLMDAHEWHGNTQLLDARGKPFDTPLPDAERISTVCYFRTDMVSCGTYAEESKKGKEAVESWSMNPTNLRPVGEVAKEKVPRVKAAPKVAKTRPEPVDMSKLRVLQKVAGPGEN
jgi:hypothetical protein